MRLTKQTLPNATPLTTDERISINEFFGSTSNEPVRCDGLPVRTRRQGTEQLMYLLFLKLDDERRAGRLERFDKIGRIVVED